MDDLWQDIQNVAKAAVPFVGGGLSFLGGLLTNSANADIARANRHFVREMYKKRYQFTVKDMRKAGLNPVLAANGGSVGSVPSVSTPTMTNALEAGVGSALSYARAVSDINAQQVNNAKTEADQKLAEANTQLTQGKKIEQDIRNQELPKTVRAQAFKAEAEASLANSASVMERARASYADRLAEYEAYQRWHEAGKSKYDFGEAQRKFKSQLPSNFERSFRYQEWMAKIRALQASPWLKGLNSAVSLFR